ncbi:GL22921 [Drosophila persimilis]|uniref:GL22921 n=1 Tax=Drosophila persimilis TaxID=7234 RepID=B4HD91_DROPE|nr:GL22921 [Drosophila persimilis]
MEVVERYELEGPSSEGSVLIHWDAARWHWTTTKPPEPSSSPVCCESTTTESCVYYDKRGCASFFTKLNYFTPFFAIESERPSEDDDLVTLPEHDFHLSSSRHAISRGTLDDIMTALDS